MSHIKPQSSFDSIRLIVIIAIMLTIPNVILQFIHAPTWVTMLFTLAPAIAVSFVFRYLNAVSGHVATVTALCAEISKGNLEERITLPLEPAGAMADLRNAINSAADNIDGFLREARYATQSAVDNKFYRTIIERGIKGSYKQVSTLMNHTMHQSENKNFIIDKLINTAQDGLNTIAASTEESSSTINEISGQLTNATETSKTTQEQSQLVSGNIASLMDNLKETADVMAMIQTITEQTNLLALNASIEAARAGEAGRGFSVVADEVRTLADATANATQKVSDLMLSIQSKVEKTEGNTQIMNTSLSKINDNTISIAAALEQQNIATEDIANSSSQIISEMNAISAELSALN